MTRAPGIDSTKAAAAVVATLLCAGCAATPQPTPTLPPSPAPTPAPTASSAPAPKSPGTLPDAPPSLKGSGAPVPPPSASAAASNTAAPNAPPGAAVGIVHLTAPSVSGRVDDAERVTASLEGPFEECYRTALASDPALHGKVMLVVHVQTDGTVSKTSSAREGASDAVAACLEARAKQAKFSPPLHGSAIVAFGATLRHASNYKDDHRVRQFVHVNARECFKTALRINPHVEGELTVTLDIDDKGLVTHVKSTPSGTLPQSLADCVAKRSRAQFKPGPATVVVSTHLALKSK